MSKRFIAYVSVVGLIVAALLVIILVDIKRTYIELGTVRAELSKVTKEFAGYKTLVQKVSELDGRLTQELANAKADNNKLRDDVNNGLKRLYIINQSSTTSGVGDAGCELTGQTRQAYFDLREAIIEFTAIAQARKEYINQVCLTKN